MRRPPATSCCSPAPRLLPRLLLALTLSGSAPRALAPRLLPGCCSPAHRCRPEGLSGVNRRRRQAAGAPGRKEAGADTGISDTGAD